MMYSFFGQNIALNLNNSAYKNTLLQELAPYKAKQKKCSIIITDDWSGFTFCPVANNPKQHFYYENVIHIKEKLTEVAFVFSGQAEVTHIYFKLITAPNTFRKIIRKWLNMQFTNRTENIGQIFHENILIPLSFFIPNTAPIHASGFIFNDKTFLLGGTGGVGKTTLELLFCQDKKASFITDDIAVISDKGFVFPNYNYPKIYGYNVVGNAALTKKLFQKASFFNKLHWFLNKKLFGIQKVRRKISPFDLYRNVTEKPVPLTNYVILFKAKSERITTKKIALHQVITATIDVILTEYAYFFNQIKWHEFNAHILHKKPIYTVQKFQDNWASTLEKALAQAANRVATIPFTIKHQEYQEQMEKIIENL